MGSMLDENGWFLVHVPVVEPEDYWQEPVIIRTHDDGSVSVLVEPTENQRAAGEHACKILASLGERLHWG